MATFTRTHTARRRHRCDLCRRPIEPGQRYDRFTATPDDDIWSTGRWTSLKHHHPYGACHTR